MKVHIIGKNYPNDRLVTPHSMRYFVESTKLAIATCNLKIRFGIRNMGCYTFQPATPMRTKSKNIRIAFWVMLGLAISFTSLALNRPSPTAQDATATPTPQTDTIVAAADAVEDVGSTDGIMLMAVVIVLIVIIPILLRRSAWSNGKRK